MALGLAKCFVRAGVQKEMFKLFNFEKNQEVLDF